jgi:hypothetical protein
MFDRAVFALFSIPIGCFRSIVERVTLGISVAKAIEISRREVFRVREMNIARYIAAAILPACRLIGCYMAGSAE